MMLKKKLQTSLNQRLAELTKGLNDAAASVLEFPAPLDRHTVSLLRKDQLTEQMRLGRAFAGFQEEPVGFLPTYKYNARSQEFDTSSKQRIPSWTDRVLYSAQSNTTTTTTTTDPSSPSDGDSYLSRNQASRLQLRPRSYDSVQGCVHGDHRPVIAQFQIDIGNDEK